jgi:hypothetical protein
MLASAFASSTFFPFHATLSIFRVKYTYSLIGLRGQVFVSCDPRFWDGERAPVLVTATLERAPHSPGKLLGAYPSLPER